MSLVITVKNNFGNVGPPQVALHRICHLFQIILVLLIYNICVSMSCDRLKLDKCQLLITLSAGMSICTGRRRVGHVLCAWRGRQHYQPRRRR